MFIEARHQWGLLFSSSRSWMFWAASPPPQPGHDTFLRSPCSPKCTRPGPGRIVCCDSSHWMEKRVEWAREMWKHTRNIVHDRSSSRHSRFGDFKLLSAHMHKSWISSFTNHKLLYICIAEKATTKTKHSMCSPSILHLLLNAICH